MVRRCRHRKPWRPLRGRRPSYGGVVLDTALALGCVGTALALLPVLVRVSPSLGQAFLTLRTVEAAVIVAGAMPMLALVWLANGGSLADAGLVPDALVGIHQASFLLGQGLVIGVNSIIIGYLVWRHRIVLPAIGLLGMIGGVLVLTSNLLQLVGVLPLSGTHHRLMAVPLFAFEIWFASYLVFVGFRPQVRTDRVVASQSGNPVGRVASQGDPS